ncbi:2-aminoadipate transaminase [compost metagenome]
MFLWARFRQPFDATAWLQATLANGVVFVPGEYFFSDKPDRSTFRLSFATATEQQMQEAVARLRRSL